MSIQLPTDSMPNILKKVPHDYIEYLYVCTCVSMDEYSLVSS